MIVAAVVFLMAACAKNPVEPDGCKECPKTTLSITSVPDSADVMIDGGSYTTPTGPIEVRPGSHQVFLVKEGYCDTLVTPAPVAIKERDIPVHVILTKKSGEPQTYVAITSSPTDALVSCNGDYIGRTPINNRPAVEGQTYALQVSKEGFVTRDTTVTAVKGENLVHVVLDTLPGLSVSASANPATIISGQSSNLTAVANGGRAPYTYTWSNGASGSSIN
ncbi:PEGA domain-containing protein, partial [Candidatus Kuenenbacteria bacterium]|nr:PEGA domain-containing protein [Candidatus Kuenenbacteria bacterium]